MPSISSEARFLGIDLRVLGREIYQSWVHMHDWPVFSWLTPAMPVVVLHPNGQQTVWLGEERKARAENLGKTRFTAIELPEDLVLRRSFTLPPVGAADVAQASALEARAISPFGAQDLVWGHRPHTLSQGNARVELVLASRKQIAQYLMSQSGRLAAGSDPEVWVLSSEGKPIVLGGYGEGLRKAHAVKWRRTGYGLMGVAGMLLVAIALTPSLQLRSRALEAAQSYTDVATRTAEIVRQRESLMQSSEKLTMLSEVLATRLEPLKVLDKLTQLLPDDTALQSFRLQGTKVTIVGMTGNASSLMQLLGNESGFREVRAPSAAMRMGNTGKETFSIEFTLDPQVFGAPVSTPLKPAVASTSVVPASNGSTPGSAVLPSAAAGSATPVAPVSTPATPPVAARPAVSPGGATFGGVATAPGDAGPKGAASSSASVVRNK
ncbi:PilN domain-containing protein [Acidovorax sp. NCPPB 2350]|nr:PilN domain-containing protein [Acidovorax sp. NCPPB 2350]